MAWLKSFNNSAILRLSSCEDTWVLMMGDLTLTDSTNVWYLGKVLSASARGQQWQTERGRN
jgi:hypothetical protein